jgi:hypothetical protein
LNNIGTNAFGDPILQLNSWATGLANTTILDLLEIPHFVRGKEAKKCVKKLMTIFHGAFLWLKQPISIDIELITLITCMPSRGENLTQYLDDKSKKKSLDEEMKKTCGIERGSCNIIIKRINNAMTQMETKILACKILRKFRKEEVLVGVIAAIA